MSIKQLSQNNLVLVHYIYILIKWFLIKDTGTRGFSHTKYPKQSLQLLEVFVITLEHM